MKGGTKMVTEEEYFEKLKEAVVEVLNVEESEIKLESRLRRDMNAESIDLLDISFELEKLVGREIDFKEVAQFIGNKTGKEVDDISMGEVVNYMQSTQGTS